MSKYTLIEKLIIFCVLLTLAGVGLFVYVLWHFISKVW